MIKFITTEYLKKYKVPIFLLFFIIVFGGLFLIDYLSIKYFGCTIPLGGSHKFDDNTCDFGLDYLFEKLIEVIYKLRIFITWS